MTHDDDSLDAALAELDEKPQPPDLQLAITRIRAAGLGTECNVLLGRGDAAWAMLRTLRDALRRTDPAWCKLHRVDQIADEDLEDAISTLEDLLEDEP